MLEDPWYCWWIRSRLHIDWVESRSFWWWTTGCAVFAVWGSQITWLTSLTGTIYLGLSLWLFLQGSWKESTFGIHPPWSWKNLPFSHFVSLWSWKKPNLFHFCHFWQMVLKEDFYLCFCEGSWKESQIVYFGMWSWKNLMNGLERTQIYFSASSVVVCHQYLINDFERSCWSCYFLCFLWLKWTW